MEHCGRWCVAHHPLLEDFVPWLVGWRNGVVVTSTNIGLRGCQVGLSGGGSGTSRREAVAAHVQAVRSSVRGRDRLLTRWEYATPKQEADLTIIIANTHRMLGSLTLTIHQGKWCTTHQPRGTDTPLPHAVATHSSTPPSSGTRYQSAEKMILFASRSIVVPELPGT